MLVIVCGCPGTGKSFLSYKLAPSWDAIHFSSDKLRKTLFSKPSYSSEENETVYSTLLKVANVALSENKTVVLDATFSRASMRKRALTIARAHSVPCYFIYCTAPDEIIKERLSQNKDRHSSDADFKIFQKIKREFEPVREKHLSLDTTQSFKLQLNQIHDFIRVQSKKQQT